MKKFALMLLVLLLLPLLAACGEDDPLEITTTEPATEAEITTGKNILGEAELRALLEAEISRQILDFAYDDYDGDGVYEAFAFVGEELDEEEGTYLGEVWFVSAKGAQKQADERDYWGLISVYAFGKSKFAVLNQYATTGGYVSVWGVHGGKPRQESVSGAGGGFTQLDDSNFTLWHSTYDMMFDAEFGTGIGHTWKNYWFFWDGQRFHEYGGVPLAEAELRKLGGAAEVLGGIEGAIGDIFYRGTNGIINVNYTVTQGEGDVSNYYVTLQLKDGKVTVLEEDSGVYQAALAPDIAVYPKTPVKFR